MGRDAAPIWGRAGSGLPLKSEVLAAFGAMVFDGVEATGGEEDKVAVGGGLVFPIDIFLDVAGAHKDDLFGAVGVWRMADFAGV